MPSPSVADIGHSLLRGSADRVFGQAPRNRFANASATRLIRIAASSLVMASFLAVGVCSRTVTAGGDLTPADTPYLSSTSENISENSSLSNDANEKNQTGRKDTGTTVAEQQLAGPYKHYPGVTGDPRVYATNSAETEEHGMLLQRVGNRLRSATGTWVTLRGVNYPHWVNDYGGQWRAEGEERWDLPYRVYRPEAVTDNLDAMNSWGANVVRFHLAIELWMDADFSFRANFKNMLGLARERGLYVIMEFYAIRKWPNLRPEAWCSLPYGEYAMEGLDRSLMPDRQAFVDLWADIASELREYDNLLFEPYNEPHGDDAVKAEYFAMMQDLINAVRAEGVRQPIIVQWGHGAWYNVRSGGTGYALDWVYDHSLNDPQDNLIVSTHVYPNSIHDAAGNAGDIYENVVAYTEAVRIDEVARDYPLIIGEIGADNGDAQAMQSMANYLQRFNELGIGYIGYSWADYFPQALLEEETWIPPPNEQGQALMHAIAGGAGSERDGGAGGNDSTRGSNNPPALEAISDKSVGEGELLEFTVFATDPDGDLLTCSASNLPSGATFDPMTGTFSWTPGAGQVGSYPDIRFEVSNGELTTSEDITITVDSNNRDGTPPAIHNVVAAGITAERVEITWTTSEPSTSQVEFGASPSKISPLDETLVTYHVVRLTGLTPATAYRYRVLSRDEQGNLAASVEHRLSTPPEAQAAFTVSELMILPAETDAGEDVTISALIANEGDTVGSHEVALSVDGAIEATRHIEDLGAGLSQQAAFSTTRNAAGSYTVEVDGTIDSFLIREAFSPGLDIPIFAVSPRYDSETGTLVVASIGYAVNRSSQSAGFELALRVSLDGEPLEEVTLLSPGLSGPHTEAGALDYVPLGGWTNGTYTFKAELRFGDSTVATSQEEVLVATHEPLAAMVSWATLGAIIGVTLVVVFAVVLVVLGRWRAMLRA